MTLVAAHQPTFLPWLGWWDKLVRADHFVLLDDVQFPKKGGTWMNRVQMIVNGKASWVTVPIDRSFHGVQTVSETVIDEQKPWRKKIEATIAVNYRRAPHFDEVYPVAEELINLPVDRIGEFNEAGIRTIAARLGLDAGKLVRQSELHVTGAATDLLINLCHALGATAYLTGDGSAGYLEPARFQAAGLELVVQQFTPPRYPQLARDYVPGLSVVDALMSCGWGGTTSLLVP